jgi:hypothetical protein
MTTIRVAITGLLEVNVEAWVAEYDNHGYDGTTPDDVAAAVGDMFNLTDQVPRWARDAVTVIEDRSRLVLAVPADRRPGTADATGVGSALS